METKQDGGWFYPGVFLLCMSTLMLQIVQTRILSVMSFYYLAFLCISMAMFGLTTGALLVYFNRSRIEGESLGENLTWLSTSFAIAIAVCFAIQLTSVAITVPMLTFVLIWLKLIVLLAIPFVFAGMAVSTALTRSPFPISIVYGVDLVGAALGCLGVVFLLNVMDAPSAMFMVAGLAALAGVCFSRMDAGGAASAGKRKNLLHRPAWIAAALAVLSVGNASIQDGLQPIGGKFGIEHRAGIDFEQWNSFSRVIATRSIVRPPALWEASPAFQPEGPVPQRELNVDGFAGTIMPEFSGDLDDVSFLRYDITNIAYQIRNEGRSGVIGVGSGRDLLSAYLFGFRDITGIEVNPIFVELLENPAKLRGYAGVADLPGVRLVVDEGRSYLTRSGDKFDLLQMSMIDTFAATGAGAFSLSENGLYTVEGWRIFLDALAPTGMFTVSRWHSPRSPVEVGRVLSLASAALIESGAANPRDHLFLVSGRQLASIIVSRSPLQPDEIATLREASDQLQFRVLVSPDEESDVPMFADLLSATDRADLDERARAYRHDVSPPTDSRPFFFNQLRISHPEDLIYLLRKRLRGANLWDFVAGSSLVLAGNLLAIGTLAIIVFLSAILVVAVIVLPARASVKAVEPSLARAGTLYFLLIGLGFMLVEIAFLQRVSTFLGHPTYALSVVLFSVILSTGAGSFVSNWVSIRDPGRIVVWLVLLGGYLLTLPLWISSAFLELEPLGLLARASASTLVIAPAGLLMGFAFPVGMRFTDAADPGPTPWFWGVNGAAGVLASGLAVAIGIGFSINVTLVIGGVCYVLLIAPAIGLSRASDKQRAAPAVEQATPA